MGLGVVDRQPLPPCTMITILLNSNLIQSASLIGRKLIVSIDYSGLKI